MLTGSGTTHVTSGLTVSFLPTGALSVAGPYSARDTHPHTATDPLTVNTRTDERVPGMPCSSTSTPMLSRGISCPKW